MFVSTSICGETIARVCRNTFIVFI